MRMFLLLVWAVAKSVKKQSYDSFRKFENVSRLSILSICFVLRIWECPGQPYLESTDSYNIIILNENIMLALTSSAPGMSIKARYLHEEI